MKSGAMYYYETEYKTGRRAGWLAVLLYCLCLGVLLLCVGFTVEVPEKPEGIVIDFGDRTEAAGERMMPQSAVRRSTPAVASGGEQQVATQQTEPAPEVAVGTDARRVEEPVKAEPQRQVDRRALFPGVNKTDAAAAEQGSDGRSPAQGSSSAGSGNQGNSREAEFDLTGRDLVGALPKPSYEANEGGRVMVNIRVDAEGNVISAEFRPEGSTTQNRALVTAALDAARKAKFTVSERELQTGTVTYVFKLK